MNKKIVMIAVAIVIIALAVRIYQTYEVKPGINTIADVCNSAGSGSYDKSFKCPTESSVDKCQVFGFKYCSTKVGTTKVIARTNKDFSKPEASFYLSGSGLTDAWVALDIDKSGILEPHECFIMNHKYSTSCGLKTVKILELNSGAFFGRDSNGRLVFCILKPSSQGGLYWANEGYQGSCGFNADNNFFPNEDRKSVV